MRSHLALPLVLVATLALFPDEGHARRVGARSSGTRHSTPAREAPEAGTARVPGVVIRPGSGQSGATSGPSGAGSAAGVAAAAGGAAIAGDAFPRLP